ncbi:aspartate 1-decarboxylase [Lysinibacillus alkalisoli]|uniref:Aspartate 1-decarboxylase n=1 Tax=Lysinibacillus alkalisoli TaxID=1911548 RepID=A0A917G167_9BACI|nr:aspartate 1-decarboxylase [Lysinibacillus alkalisoli]GGG17663.1 aspartate 1-decarboxylase [Lysinibacillus alkalisoli]
MLRTMMHAKIHRASVTEANLNYVGSITIDIALLEAVGILPNELVAVVNNNNGARFETYTIAGARGSGVICVNGAAARLVQPSDIIIIIAYGQMTTEEAKQLQPKVAVMNADNTIKEMINYEPPLTIG